MFENHLRNLTLPRDISKQIHNAGNLILKKSVEHISAFLSFKKKGIAMQILILFCMGVALLWDSLD